MTELAKKSQLGSIIDLFSEHNVPVILLKGAAFTEVLYSSQAPRTSNDLDILIKNSDWSKAVSLIKSLMNYTEKSQPDVFGDLYELSFMPKEKVGSALDLHLALTNPVLFNINEEQLWEQSVEHPSFNNERVRMLSAEHALIHQAVHAYSDMDFSKYNLIDSHELIRVQQPDIKKTIEISKEWGANIALFTLLQNCNQIMESNIKIDNKSKNNSASYKKTDLLKQIKPNPIIYKIMGKLIKSRFSQPIGNTKPLRYRANQILGQYIFTGSVVRLLTLQWLFIKSKLIGTKKVN